MPITFPDDTIAHQKSIADSLSGTFKIYKEHADYMKTPAQIKDLDGKPVIKATPREIELSYHATRARTATDENAFELSDSDIDTLFPTLPDISGLFNMKFSTEIYKDLLNKNIKGVL